MRTALCGLGSRQQLYCRTYSPFLEVSTHDARKPCKSLLHYLFLKVGPKIYEWCSTLRV